jgi:hypothetical protein
MNRKTGSKSHFQNPIKAPEDHENERSKANNKIGKYAGEEARPTPRNRNHNAETNF